MVLEFNPEGYSISNGMQLLTGCRHSLAEMRKSILKCIFVWSLLIWPAGMLCAAEKYAKYFELVRINQELMSQTALRSETTISWIVADEEALGITSKMKVTTFYKADASPVIPGSVTIQRGGQVIYTAEPKDFSMEPGEGTDSNEKEVILYVKVPPLQPGDQIQKQYSFVRTASNVTAHAGLWASDMRAATVTKKFEYTLTAPRGMQVNVEGYSGFSLTQTNDSLGQQVWHYTETLPYVEAFAEMDAPSLKNYAPTILISTYANWKQLGDFYLEGEAAAMQAGLSQKMLANIVGDARSDRDIATAAFRWIQTNLRYDATRISAENRLRPRDLDVVLTSRTADCKEMVMVMKAVLAAKGITSQTVAVDADSYRRPTIAGVPFFNHVLAYIPSLEVYVDPTNKVYGFGVIGHAVNGKKILRFGEAELDEIHTPISANAVNSIENIVINNDGLIASDLKVMASGTGIRSVLFFLDQPISKQKYVDALKKHGSKTEVDVVSVHLSDERGKGGPVILSANQMLPVGLFTSSETSASSITLPKSVGLGALVYQLPLSQSTPRQSPVACRLSSTGTDDVIYTFPEKYVLNPLDQSKITFNTGIFNYEREVIALKPNSIKIHRRLVINSNKDICPASDYAIFVDFAREIIKDYSRPLVRISEK